MAIPKSANERIRRRLRRKKIGPKSTDMVGRVVVKKTADNDPDRNNGNHHEGMSEEFLRWYKGDDIPNTGRFRQLVESLLSVGIEAAGEMEFPFSISRLTELRESIGAPRIIVKTEMIPREIHICPACHEEILEKSTFLPEDQRSSDIVEPEWEHRSCGGRFTYPPVDKIDVLRRLGVPKEALDGRGEH